MDLLLRGGRVIDTSGGAERPVDAALDVLIRDGRIAEVGSGLAAPAGAREVDVRDRLVVPGLVDLHVHLREPGHEYKEDIESGTRSAAAGGFTTVCCMPNTSPTNDCRAVTELITRRAREVGSARVLPIGAVSKGLEGKALAEFGEMRDAGIVAVSDDGRPVMDSGLMRRALEYARTFDLPVVQHAEDLGLSAGFAMNEGEVSTRLGLPGQPGPAESVMVARDIELCELTGGRYHVAHVSVARSVELIREAKRRGLPVSGEVTPHHMLLLDHACDGYDTCFKVAPPLRTEADRQALIEALADGTIECIATDHAPHSSLEKDVDFEAAACGMLGLETALPITLGLVRDGSLTLLRAIDALTAAPARLFDLDRRGIGSLAAGAPADICVIDLDRAWTVDRHAMRSKSKNTPFHGREVVGAAQLTLLAGRPVYDPQEMLA
jgi:dihydroorotase